jgi:hypothetical protein
MGDPSRAGRRSGCDGGDPGALRLRLELLMLCGAVVALFAADRRWLALAMAVLVVVDFTLSYDRVGRLLGL